MSNDLNKGNYELVLDYTISNFKHSDVDLMSKLSGSPYNYNKKYFTSKFLNKTIYIRYPSGEVLFDNGQYIDDVSVKILIIRFLINSKGVKQTYKYITYKEIEGGYVYYPNFKSRTIKNFVNRYGKDINLFKNNMEKLDATKIDLGDISYKVRFINDIYIVFILWEGDDELEPSGNILFDSSIICYFNAEDLAVIPDIILNNLK
jgi:hypothetical protein